MANLYKLPVTRMTDTDLARLSTEELIRCLRRSDFERTQALQDKSNIIQDVNKKLQSCLTELRMLKDVNQKLQNDNQELRDLCCFLDDDRQQSRRLSQEWQKFGRYTASVMQTEVAQYQNKLQNLELQQQIVIKENFELKELCLALDKELRHLTNCEPLEIERDQGDGSSNSSATEKAEDLSPRPVETVPVVDIHTLDYIRSLENRVQHLERERRGHPQHQMNGPQHSTGAASEAVSRAMKVLEVHEQIARPEADELKPAERALLQQMCNVVWKKLGDSAPSKIATDL